jgi:hypothetical protein
VVVADRQPWLKFFLALGLAALFVGLTAQARLCTSATNDEPWDLQLGIDLFRRHEFQGMVYSGVAPLPIWLCYALPAHCTRRLVVPLATRAATPNDLFLPETVTLTALARCCATLLVGVPIILGVFLWLARRVELASATLGTLLVVCSPCMLAHAPLATTDGCMVLMGLLALFSVHRYRQQPCRSHLLLAGASTGLLWASKVLGLLLLPWLIWNVYAARPRPTLRAWCTLAGSAFLICWALSGPAWYAIPVAGYSVMVPAPVRTVWGQWVNVNGGHPSFMLGRVSDTGFWDYFPVAFALKSSPAEWLLALLLALSFCRAQPADVRLLRGAAISYFLLTMALHVDIGVRYILLVYPLLALAGCLLCHRHRYGRLVLCGLAALQVGTALVGWPYYLSYFGFVPGGVRHRLLVDSNLDWGQDLPALKEQVEKHHIHHLALIFLGTAVPAAYGIHTEPPSSACDWLAISATPLEEDRKLHAFLSMQADATAGTSILLYRTDRPEVRTALQTAF